MAKTFTAPFAQTPKTNFAVCVAANTTLTGSPDDTVLLCTAGSDGAIVTRITCIPRVTLTAAVAYLYISKDSGTTQTMIDAVTLAADTVSTTDLPLLVVFTQYSETTPLRLEAADRLYVGISVAFADGVAFRAEFTDF
jgi:hypothetical protein